jgi:hypothetical protein
MPLRPRPREVRCHAVLPQFAGVGPGLTLARYNAKKRIKQDWIQDRATELGDLHHPVSQMVPSPTQTRTSPVITRYA